GCRIRVRRRWPRGYRRCSWLRWACDSVRGNTTARDALVRTPAGVVSRRGLDRFFSLAPDSRAEAVRFLTLPCGNTLPEAAGPHARSLGQRIPAREREESDSRSEEHTSELQSRFDLVCRLLLEKKKHSEQHKRD